jgi:RHS repeat-associated protein
VTSLPAGNFGGETADFVYGADGSRVLQNVESEDPTRTGRTVYVGLGATGRSLYERTVKNGITEHVQYLYADEAHDGNPFGIFVTSGATPDSLTTTFRAYHRDHLGSVTAMSDESGHVQGPQWAGTDADVLGYDAWGARRNPDGSTADASTFSLKPGGREFTGHEQVPDVGLVNMNGRLYDPGLGRFLSPDPQVQYPGDLQSFNRYSYVANNPLSHVDPTGYGFGFNFDTAFNIGAGIVEIAACAGSYGLGCVAAASFITSSYNASAMLDAGASRSQTLTALGISFAVGSISGVAGGAIGGAISKNITGAIIGGAISGAMATAATTVAMGGSLGWNVLAGAAEGAALGAFGWPNRPTPPVVQAPEDPFGGVSPDLLMFEGALDGPHKNGDYIGPPGGLWGDTSARDGLGIIGPNGEAAPDTSTGWLLFPWTTLSTISGAAAALNVGRSLLFGTGVRVLWSGGGLPYAGTAARAWAEANGAMTLEMTLAGRALTALKPYVDFRLTLPLWKLASRGFAATAAGDVHLFVSATRSLGNFFMDLELPAIIENPAVQNFGIHLLP